MICELLSAFFFSFTFFLFWFCNKSFYFELKFMNKLKQNTSWATLDQSNFVTHQILTWNFLTRTLSFANKKVHIHTGMRRNQHPGNYRKHSTATVRGLPLLMKSLFAVCLGFSYAAESFFAYRVCLPPKTPRARLWFFLCVSVAVRKKKRTWSGSPCLNSRE